MPSKCAVIGCSNRAERERDKRFYRVPVIIKTHGQHTEELSRKRRAQWFSNISRADLDENKTHLRVCSDHFITGKPSRLYPENSVDWAPTLQLGHNKLKSNAKLSVSKHDQNARRQEKKRISTFVDALSTFRDFTCVGEDDTGLLGMDLHAKPEDCNHGYSDLPNVNLPTQIKMEIEDIPLAEEIMTCSEDKGEVTQGIPRLQQSSYHNDITFLGVRNQATSVDVVTPMTELSEIHPTFQEDNDLVVRTCRLDPETKSVTLCPEPSSVRYDIEHLRQHLPRGIVKQEVLDTDDGKALHDSYVKDQNMDDSAHGKPVLGSSCPTANSASLRTQCLMESHDSSTSPGLMPVGLYYNTVHLRHLIKSEGRESLPGMDIRVEEKNDDKLPVNDLPSPKPTHNGGKPYTCKSLQEHERAHTGKEPFVCKFCNKGFRYWSSLKKHERVHTGEKPYTCNICNKIFAESGNLKKHQRRHTGEKPYTCNICNKGFFNSSNFKRHLRIHTGEKSYTCKPCSKSFSQLISLNNHECTHTGENPYTCNICNMKFAKSGSLKKHQIMHTGKNP